MENVRFVGMDVHEASITIAVADGDGSEPMVLRRIPHDLNLLVNALKDLAARKKLSVVYEAGPSGFGIFHKLKAAKIQCAVVAPSRVPTQGKNKTDAEDAIRLARFLRSGDLKGIYVPSAEVEGLRAVTRAREDALKAQQTARGQLRQFLVREGRKYDGKSAWTKVHLKWIEQQEFDHPAKKVVRDDYVREVEAVAARIVRLTEAIEAVVASSPLAPLITALQALRGVQLITAATIAAEVGDFYRFESAPKFMSYVGIVPREFSSGERQRQGTITKAGNSHLRRVLGEAAWSYRFSGAGAGAEKRRAHVPKEVKALADRAQERLHQRWQRMTLRKKESNKVCIAVARELAGFMWAIGQCVPLPAANQQQQAAK